MTPPRYATIALLNDFAHDLFTGLWLCATAALFLLHFRFGTLTSAAQGALVVQELLFLFFRIQTTALGLITITGYFRYRNSRTATPDIPPDRQALRRRLLVVKHIVLGILFLVGTVLGVLWS